MKKLNVLLIVLIFACMALFLGYRMVDNQKTDTVAPEIRMEDTIPRISVKDPEKALLRGVTATDNKDGDVTDSLVVENVTLLDKSGKLLVSYAAFDRAGNVAKAQREAQYKDYESPKFTMEAPLLYRYGSGFDVLSTIGATDVIDGDIQHRIRATSIADGSIAEMGIHGVKFQVTNSLGDTVSHVFRVEVYDPTIYDAKLELSKYLVYLPKGSSFNPEQYLESFTQGQKTVELYGRLLDGYTLETEGMVNTWIPGAYSVGIRVTYKEVDERNKDLVWEYTGYTRLFVIVEG